MKKIISILAIFALCAGIIQVPDAESKTKLSVTPSMNLNVGQSQIIKVKGSNIQSKKYKTTNKKIATVSSKGRVQAKNAGKCKIIVTIKYKETKKTKKYIIRKFFCRVTVRKVSGTTLKMFRSEELLREHYEKHGREMGFASPREYLAGANAVIRNSNVLHKKEKEDGDDVYYVEETNDFVIVSTDGYIRTYFRPEDGIAYYNRQ